MTGILILIGSLKYMKEAKKMDMIVDKCKFQNSFPYFQLHMLLVNNGIASLTQRQFQHVIHVHVVCHAPG